MKLVAISAEHGAGRTTVLIGAMNQVLSSGRIVFVVAPNGDMLKPYIQSVNKKVHEATFKSVVFPQFMEMLRRGGIPGLIEITLVLDELDAEQRSEIISGVSALPNLNKRVTHIYYSELKDDSAYLGTLKQIANQGVPDSLKQLSAARSLDHKPEAEVGN